MAEGPLLVGAYVWGVIAFGAPNLHGWSYRLCPNHCDNSCVGCCRANSLRVSGFYFLWDSLPFFVRLRTATPLGGGDVVHCVWVSLTCTTVVPFWAHWSLVGDWFVQLHSLCDIMRGNVTPLMLFVRGPRLGNVARGI